MQGWLALVTVAMLLLLGGTALTAHRPERPVADRAGYLDGWRRDHGGYDPAGSRVMHAWLSTVYALARPLATAGLKPDLLTLWTLWLNVLAVTLASRGGVWAVGAGLLVLAGGLGDAMDGAVAVLSGRTTRWGYVLDSFVDRLSDLLCLVALWLVGGPGLLVALTGAGVLLLEYVRARGANAGTGEIGTITVAERPSRVIGTAATLVAVGASPERAATLLATLGLSVLAALTLVGLAQLLLAVRRRLRQAEEGRHDR